MKIKQGKGLLAQIEWINSGKWRDRDSKGRFVPIPKRTDPMSLEELVRDLNHNDRSQHTIIYTGIDGMNKLNELMNTNENDN